MKLFNSILMFINYPSCCILLLLLLNHIFLLQPASCIDLIVIGDSTAADYSSTPYLYPEAGWAMFLGDHVDSQASGIVVRNLAVGGRSSKSYYDEKLWEQAKANYLSAGDYVFIQFGHNDQKEDSNLHTDPFTTYQQYLTIYVDDVRAARANPVLLTSMARAVWSNGVLQQTLGDYPAAVRQLAEQLQVPLIDMNAETTALFNNLGEQATQNNLFMCLPAGKYSNYPNGITDTTHLQEAGAKQVAAMAAQGIINANLPIGAYVNT